MTNVEIIAICNYVNFYTAAFSTVFHPHLRNEGGTYAVINNNKQRIVVIRQKTFVRNEWHSSGVLSFILKTSSTIIFSSRFIARAYHQKFIFSPQNMVHCETYDRAWYFYADIWFRKTIAALHFHNGFRTDNNLRIIFTRDVPFR